MRNAGQRFPRRFMFVPGILLGLMLGQVAPASSDEQPPTQTAGNSTSETATAPMTGLKIYNEVCVACHAAPGIGGAPALGDSDAWAARIDRGKNTLIDHALNGYSGSTGIMPKKGGRIDLSDAEIIAAVEYMVEQVTP